MLVACPHRLLRTTRRAQQLLGEARRKTRVEMPRTEGDVDGKVRERAVVAACKGGQRETRKRNLEERFGLEERDAGAQGDCQFRAVSYAIHGTAGHHAQLRRLAVESLAARDITGRVEGCAKQYLARMARLGTWGDHLTLQALAWEVGRRVVVFELAPDDTMRATVLWPGETGKAGDLLHYRAVRWREEVKMTPVRATQVKPQLNVGLPLRTNNSGPERPTRHLPGLNTTSARSIQSVKLKMQAGNLARKGCVEQADPATAAAGQAAARRTSLRERQAVTGSGSSSGVSATGSTRA
ncbi:hypothetical protein DIPPA_10439 [Diplonema papillatum]|nr:hypothetical protein DIPPA_10439 [Diplonema papillatum]